MKTKEKDECSYSVSNAIRTLVMMKAAGLEFPEILERIIRLAME